MVPIDVNHSTDGNFPSDLETVNIVIFKDPSARALNFARSLRFLPRLAATVICSWKTAYQRVSLVNRGTILIRSEKHPRLSGVFLHFLILSKKFLASFLWKNKNGSFKNLHKNVQKVALVLDAPSGFGNTLVYYLSGLSDASTIIYPRRA